LREVDSNDWLREKVAAEWDGEEGDAADLFLRRPGGWWLDLVALKRSFNINSVTGLCVTKLDVLDGLETIKLAVAYRFQDEETATPPSGAENIADCEPVYIEMSGWAESTVGLKSWDELPAAAVNYLKKIEEICQVPIDIISTGPDRTETIVLKHPFSA
jgi:adenylosuccinate synthase